MEKIKEAYSKPKISVIIIELEEGIAATSRYIVPGSTDGSTPIIEDWKEGPLNQKEITF